ncbi:winged helix-turn-helix transcriptional regulator [Paenibacillus cymbidii]|uniref:winged helix-turn-helix transcriptional regulator n=1 Tax=Paenibacillus cymbidii TaxID=1639034 RepID=UPI0022A83845|nr:winged helix-turn-helix transcriptional regulator [Paenibacillus cymbidii]
MKQTSVSFHHPARHENRIHIGCIRAEHCQLEKTGLVKRTVFPLVPPQVEYALTPLGETLFAPLTAIGQWMADHEQDLKLELPASKQKRRLKRSAD